MIVVAALYKFVSLDDFESLQAPLKDVCEQNYIKGTILLAHEGINGTIAGPREGIDTVLGWLRKDPRLADLEWKESFDDEHPFYRLKIKLKKEIVTMGVAGVDPNQKVGQYVAPENWNELISDPEVLVIDTRNQYEVAIGTFEGAVNPGTTNFREFPQYVEKQLDPSKQKKVAMFCTGGIRCEKASSYMLNQGFEEVYHLQGGILKYLENVPKEESKWQGECFVFDNRVAVKDGLEPGSYDQCHACRHPVSEDDKRSSDWQPGISCPHCANLTTEEQRKRFEERQKQVTLAKERGVAHVGAPPPARQLR